MVTMSPYYVEVKDIPEIALGSEPIVVDFREDRRLEVLSNPYIEPLPEPVRQIHPLGKIQGVFDYDDLGLAFSFSRSLSNRTCYDRLYDRNRFLASFVRSAIESFVHSPATNDKDRKFKYDRIRLWLSETDHWVNHYFLTAMLSRGIDPIALKSLIDHYKTHPSSYTPTVGIYLNDLLHMLPTRSDEYESIKITIEFCGQYDEIMRKMVYFSKPY